MVTISTSCWGRYRRQVNHRQNERECLEADDGSYQGYVSCGTIVVSTFTLMERVVEGVTDVVDDDNYTVSVRVAHAQPNAL
jgi:hypothetical protein